MGLLKGSSGCGRKEPFTSGEEWQISTRFSHRLAFPHCDTTTGYLSYINLRATSAGHEGACMLLCLNPMLMRHLTPGTPQVRFIRASSTAFAKRQPVVACRTWP